MDTDRYNAEREAKVAAEMQAERTHSSNLRERERRYYPLKAAGNRKQRRAAMAKDRRK